MYTVMCFQIIKHNHLTQFQIIKHNHLSQFGRENSRVECRYSISIHWEDFTWENVNQNHNLETSLETMIRIREVLHPGTNIQSFLDCLFQFCQKHLCIHTYIPAEIQLGVCVFVFCQVSNRRILMVLTIMPSSMSTLSSPGNSLFNYQGHETQSLQFGLLWNSTISGTQPKTQDLEFRQ